MSTPLRVLIVEDSDDDALLVLRELRRGGYDPIYEQVQSADAMWTALADHAWDVVLSDYSMPGFGALDALELLKNSDLDLPFIIVSGTIGEDAAVAALKAGAHDFLVKGSLARLIPAIQREVREADVRRGHRRAEANYRRLVEQIPAVTYISLLDDIATPTFVSPQLEALLGFTPTEWVADPGLRIRQLHPEDRERVMGHYAGARMDQRPFHLEYRMVARDGREVWVHDDARVMRDDAGRPAFIHGLLFDITERKRAEQALRESEVRFSILFRASPASISVTTLRDGRFVDINESFEQVMGYQRREVIGRTAQELGIWAEQEAGSGMLAALIEAGSLQNIELRFRTKSGEIMDTLNSLEIIELDGEPCILGIALDITERKQRERRLEAIASISVALRGPITRTEMPPVVLDQLSNLLNADRAILMTVDSSTRETVVESTRNVGPDWNGESSSSGSKIGELILATGKPYVTHDLVNDPLARLLHETPERSTAALIAPLITQGETIGIVVLGRTTDWAENDTRTLMAMTDIAANALQRASLHEETQRRLRQLQTLRIIDEAITGSFDMRLPLTVLLDQAIASLQVDAADVLLLNHQTQILEYAMGRGFRTDSITRSRLRVGEGHAGRAALERELVVVPNIREAGERSARSELLAGEGFTTYYGVPLIAKGQVKGVLDVFCRTPMRPHQDWLDFLEAIARQAAIAIDNSELFQSLQRSNIELQMAYDTTLEGWSYALDLRDRETEGHTRRVTEMTLQLARAMGIADEELIHIRRGALLHDIGKMGIPDQILLKPGPLNPEEWTVMRRHPTYAFELLSPIHYLRPALDIPYCHHEKWDGTGYPRELKGEEIPPPARLFAVVDVWDALRSDRPYRPAWSKGKVLEHIQSLRGTHFEPQVVDAFLRIIEQTPPAS